MTTTTSPFDSDPAIVAQIEAHHAAQDEAMLALAGPRPGEGGWRPAPPPPSEAPQGAPPPEAPQGTSGTAAPVVSVVRAPRVLHWIDVPEYDGYQARVWLNVTRRCLDDVNSGDQERALAALQEILVAHNGWADPDGEPYPAADAPDFWLRLPIHLVGAIVQGVRAGVVASKNSPGPKRP